MVDYPPSRFECRKRVNGELVPPLWACFWEVFQSLFDALVTAFDAFFQSVRLQWLCTIGSTKESFEAVGRMVDFPRLSLQVVTQERLRSLRRLLTIVLVLTFVGTGAWLEREVLLRSAADLWIVSDQVTQGDAIVVLGRGSWSEALRSS